MKKVILFYYEGQDESSFLSSSRDECNQPYVDFRDYLLDIGIKLEMTPNRPLEDYMYICFWNMYSVKAFNVISKMKRSAASFVEGRGVTSIYQKCVKKGLKEKMVLFLSEPASVVPENYVTQDHYNFSYIFTWSSKLLNRDRHLYKYFNIPTNFSSQRCDKFSFDRKKLLVDISGNKYSKHPREDRKSVV